jgi:hypothetical protein
VDSPDLSGWVAVHRDQFGEGALSAFEHLLALLGSLAGHAWIV